MRAIYTRYNLLLSSIVSASRVFLDQLSKAKCPVKQGGRVGCWNRIFSARRGNTDGCDLVVQVVCGWLNLPYLRLAVIKFGGRGPLEGAKKKRSRITGSGSLRRRISLPAAERDNCYTRLGMQSTACVTTCSSCT